MDTGRRSRINGGYGGGAPGYPDEFATGGPVRRSECKLCTLCGASPRARSFHVDSSVGRSISVISFHVRTAGPVSRVVDGCWTGRSLSHVEDGAGRRVAPPPAARSSTTADHRTRVLASVAVAPSLRARTFCPVLGQRGEENVASAGIRVLRPRRRGHVSEPAGTDASGSESRGVGDLARNSIHRSRGLR